MLQFNLIWIWLISLSTSGRNRFHSEATKLTLPQVTTTCLSFGSPVPENTPFLAQNPHSSLRMPGYELHPKFRF